MAAKTKTKAEKAEETEEDTSPVARSQMEKHEDLVAYIEGVTGEDLNTMDPVSIVALAFKHRNAWRDTAEYKKKYGSRKGQKASGGKSTSKAKSSTKAKSTRGRKTKADEDETF